MTLTTPCFFSLHFWKKKKSNYHPKKWNHHLKISEDETLKDPAQISVLSHEKRNNLIFFSFSWFCVSLFFLFKVINWLDETPKMRMIPILGEAGNQPSFLKKNQKKKSLLRTWWWAPKCVGRKRCAIHDVVWRQIFRVGRPARANSYLPPTYITFSRESLQLLMTHFYSLSSVSELLLYVVIMKRERTIIINTFLSFF